MSEVATKKEEYTKQDYLEVVRGRVHKDAPPSYFACQGANRPDCPCKGCATPRELEKAGAEWDKDRGASEKAELEAEFGPKEPKN